MLNLLNLLIEKNLSINELISNLLIYLYLNISLDDIWIDKSYISYVKDNFNYNLFIFEEDEINIVKEILIKIKLIKYDNVLNDIINYIQSNKELNLHYKNNNNLTDYVISLTNPKAEKIANMFSGYGNFLIKLQKENNLYGFESDEELRLWSILNIFIATGKMMDKNIILSDIIHDNIIIDSYDLIISEFPINIRNIIHANCCNKIKNLKIRGTKSEPLILQLIMTSLNKNGRACLIVPDNLLYNESKQHIDTRKYLLENFNVKKIISISKDLHNIKSTKKSILYFDKKGKTEEINFSKLYLKENKIIEKHISKINYDEISKNNFILYNEKYSNNEIKISHNLIKLKDLVDIITTNTNEISSLNNNYLLFPNYITDNKKIEIFFDNFNLKKDTFTVIVKDQNVCLQKYLNYYLLQTLLNNILLYTTGKLNKIDFEKLLEIKIDIPSINTQSIIGNYFDLNYKIIEINNELILHYSNLKKEFISLFDNKFDKIKLKTICSIEKNNSNKDSKIIIQKNSNAAGTVSLINDENIESNNIYCLNDINKKYDKKCLYYILKNKEAELFNLASLTVTISLNRTNLENFEIEDYPKEIQEKIIFECDKYDNICNNLEQFNNTIISKNIIHEINKIEKFKKIN